MGLITETSAQYYSGQQAHVAVNNGTIAEVVKWTGDTVLKPSISGVQNANYKVIYKNQILVENTDYTLVDNVLSITKGHASGDIFFVQLVDSAIKNNYGGYAYTKLDDIVNNFIVAYVGDGKMVTSVKRTDVVFFAKRAIE